MVSQRSLPAEDQVVFVHVGMTVESSSALVLLYQSDPEERVPGPEEGHQEPVDRACLFPRSQRALGSFESVIVENVHHRPPPHVSRQRSSLPQIDLVSPERCQAYYEVQGFRSQGRDCDRCLPFESFINRPALWPISSQNQFAKGSRGSPCPFGISVFDLKNNSHARSARTDRSVTWSSRTIFILVNTSSKEVFKIAWEQPRSLLGEGFQSHS